MNIVDGIIFILFAFYFWRGWAKGLLKSIFGPIAFVACFFYSYLYFQRTHNFAISVAICILGPIMLNLILAVILAIFHKANSKDGGTPKIKVVNRFLGGLLNLSWSGTIVLITICFFLMIPVKVARLQGLRASLLQSRTVGVLAHIFGERFPFLNQDTDPVDVQGVQAHFTELRQTEEFQDLIKDERVRVIYEAPEIEKMIKAQDIFGLMNDPRIQGVMQDPELVQRFLKMNKKIIEMNQTK